MQIDLSTEYVKMADLLSVDPVGLQVKVQVISGTVLVTETMTQPQASSNFGFAFGKTQIFTSTGAGGDLYIRGTTQNSTIEVTVSAGDFNAGISPFNGGSAGTTTNPIETPASIKQKYESNPDTNAFTDEEKEAVQELIDGGGSTGVSNVDVTYNSSSKVLAVSVDETAGSAVLTGVATESYSDSKKNEAVQEAKTYTDEQIAAIPGAADTYTKQEIDSKDQNILAEAKTYTDQHSGGGGGSFNISDNVVPVGKDGNLVDSGVSIVDGKIALAPNSLGIGHHTYSSAGEKSLLKNESNNNNGAVLTQDDVDGSVELINYTSSELEYLQGQTKSQNITNPEFNLNIVDFGFYKIDSTESEIEFATTPTSTVLLQFFNLDELISTNKIQPSSGLTTFEINPLYLSGASDISVKITQANGQDVVLKGSGSRPYFKFSYRTYNADYVASEALMQDAITEAKPKRLESTVQGQTLTNKLTLGDNTELIGTVVLPSTGGGSVPAIDQDTVPVYKDGTYLNSGITSKDGKVTVLKGDLDLAYKNLLAVNEEVLLNDSNSLNESILLKHNLENGKVEIPVFEDTKTFTQGSAKTEDIVNPEFQLRGVVGQGYYMIDTDFQAYMQYANLPTSNILLEIFRDDVLIHSKEIQGTATGTPSDVDIPRLFIAADTPIKIKMSLVDGTDLTLVGSDGLPFLELPYKPYVLRDIAAASSGEGNPVASIEHNVNDEGLETLVTLQDGTPITSNRIELETSDPRDLAIEFRAKVETVINANAGVCYSYENEAVVRPYSSLFDVSLMGIATETIAQGDIKVAVRGVFPVVNLDISDHSEGEVVYYGDDNMLGFNGQVGANQHPIGLYLGGATLFIDVDVYNRSKDIQKARAASEFDLLKANTIVAIDQTDNFIQMDDGNGMMLQAVGKTIVRSNDSLDFEIGGGDKKLTITDEKITSALPIDAGSNSISNVSAGAVATDAVNLQQVQTLIAESGGGGGGGGSGDVSWAGDLDGNESKILLSASGDGKTIKSSEYYEADLRQMIEDVNGNGQHIEEINASIGSMLESVTQNTNRVGAAESQLSHLEFPQITSLDQIGITDSQITSAENKTEIAKLFFEGSVSSADHHKYILYLNVSSSDAINSLLPNNTGGVLIVTSVEAHSLHRLDFSFVDASGNAFFASMTSAFSSFIDFVQIGSSDTSDLEARLSTVEQASTQNTASIGNVEQEVGVVQSDIVALEESEQQTKIKVDKLIEATYDRPHLDSIGDLNLTDDSFVNANTPQEVLEIFRQAPYLGGFTTWELTLKTDDNYHGMLPEQGGFFVIQRFDSLLYAHFFAESGKAYIASIATDGTYHDWKDVTQAGGGDTSSLEQRVAETELAIVEHDTELGYMNTYSTDSLDDLNITAEEIRSKANQGLKAEVFHSAEIGEWEGANWRFTQPVPVGDDFYGFLGFQTTNPGMMVIDRFSDVDGNKFALYTYTDKLTQYRWMMDQDSTFAVVQSRNAAIEEKVTKNEQATEVLLDITDYAVVKSPDKLDVTQESLAAAAGDPDVIAKLFADAYYTVTKTDVSYRSDDYTLKFFVNDGFHEFTPEQLGVLTVSKTQHGDGACVEFDFSAVNGTRYWAHYHAGTFIPWRYINGSFPVPDVFKIYAGWDDQKSLSQDDILNNSELFETEATLDTFYSVQITPSRASTDYKFTFIAYPKSVTEVPPKVNYNNFPADWEARTTTINGIEYTVLTPEYANNENNLTITLVEA